MEPTLVAGDFVIGVPVWLFLAVTHRYRAVTTFVRNGTNTMGRLEFPRCDNSADDGEQPLFGSAELRLPRGGGGGMSSCCALDGRVVIFLLTPDIAYCKRVSHATYDGEETRLFVLGDNRGHSFDSRDFGTVPLAAACSVVVLSLRQSQWWRPQLVPPVQLAV